MGTGIGGPTSCPCCTLPCSSFWRISFLSALEGDASMRQHAGPCFGAASSRLAVPTAKRRIASPKVKCQVAASSECKLWLHRVAPLPNPKRGPGVGFLLSLQLRCSCRRMPLFLQESRPCSRWHSAAGRSPGAAVEMQRALQAGAAPSRTIS